MSVVLSARGIAAGYQQRPIVKNLDLVVRRGEIVALLGPNGAGKSTTLLALAGELKLLAGEVSFLGQKTSAPLHRRARQGLAFVTEDRALFTRLSVAENLRVGRCDTAKALTLFPELNPLLRIQAGLLSGGEQQMLRLGRALARNPKLLLVDELSLGLAPLVVTRLMEALRRAADDDGVGVLLVEQHVRRALEVADEVNVMRRGEIVVRGPRAEMATRLEQIESSYLTSVAANASAVERSDDES
jgi:branched-chain amino acid transport system ATP-binding protein